jgi:hypothetical protein
MPASFSICRARRTTDTIPEPNGCLYLTNNRLRRFKKIIERVGSLK